MVRIRKAHPAKEIFFVRNALEPFKRSIGDPIRVVGLAGDRIPVHLNGTRISSACAIDSHLRRQVGVEASNVLGSVLPQPGTVVENERRIRLPYLDTEDELHA